MSVFRSFRLKLRQKMQFQPVLSFHIVFPLKYIFFLQSFLTLSLYLAILASIIRTFCRAIPSCRASALIMNFHPKPDFIPLKPGFGG